MPIGGAKRPIKTGTTQGADSMKTFIDYINDENGQTSTEYILLLAVIALLVMKFKNKAQTQIESLTENIFGAGEAVADKVRQEAMSQ